MVALSELTPLGNLTGLTGLTPRNKEFYEVTESSLDLSDLKDELLEWEGVYNTVRPHQTLGYVTPLKFLEQWKECQDKEDVSLII